MGLPGDEQAVLREIDAALERDDPVLAWRLKTLPGLVRDARRDAGPVSWRPPRGAVALAAVVVAVAALLVVGVALGTRHPCEPGVGATAPTAHHVRSSGPPGAADRGGGRPAVPRTSRATC